MNDQDNDYSLFSGPKLLNSIAHSGYKNTTYAIAELVDNSIDAHARNIDVMFQDQLDYNTGRYKLEQIGVFVRYFQ